MIGFVTPASAAMASMLTVGPTRRMARTAASSNSVRRSARRSDRSWVWTRWRGLVADMLPTVTLPVVTVKGGGVRVARMRVLAALAALGLTLSACGADHGLSQAASSSPASIPTSTAAPTSTTVPPPPPSPDVYAADRPNQLSPVVAGFPSRIYVPNSVSNTVDVLDPATNTIVDHFDVGAEPQHVVPSYDLKTLYVASDRGNTLTPIAPATGAHGAPIHVDDPYNLYFTPDGRYAVVVAERLARLAFRDPRTFDAV